jgi:hypothetical protein
MKSKTIVIIFLSLITAVLVAYIVLSMLSPIRAIKLVNENYPDTILTERVSDELLKIEKKEAFLRARLKMAKADSVCLSINLVDSLVIMEIQGVKLLETKILKIQTSKIFTRFKKQAFFDYFSSPFVIDSDYSTIPKEFFNIKYAPEDTLAAQAPKTIPDSTLNYPVCFTLYLDRDIMVDIRQTDTLKTEKFREYKNYLHNEKIRKMWSHLYKFKVPPYDPWIRIEIPHNDARSIYKALPHHAQVAIIM